MLAKLRINRPAQELDEDKTTGFADLFHLMGNWSQILNILTCLGESV